MTVLGTAVTLAALLAVPASAHGGTVALDGVTVIYTSTAGGDNGGR